MAGGSSLSPLSTLQFTHMHSQLAFMFSLSAFVLFCFGYPLFPFAKCFHRHFLRAVIFHLWLASYNSWYKRRPPFLEFGLLCLSFMHFFLSSQCASYGGTNIKIWLLLLLSLLHDFQNVCLRDSVYITYVIEKVNPL